MVKEEEENNTINLKQKLINSSAINSLRQELNIFKKLKRLGWGVEHSPYYLDTSTGKYREIDISARKYWIRKKEEDIEKFSFGINFIIECKSINNYQIVVCNEQNSESGSYLENNWIGDDGQNNYPKTIKLLQKHNIKDSDIQETLKAFHKQLFPEGIIRYFDYKLESFKIPTYCAFRETNIGTTKEMENSVVWKAYQSLYSVIRSYKANVWEDIDYELYNIENEEYLSSYKSRLIELKRSLFSTSEHFEIIHPILVLESKLWELKDNNISEIKYCRLIFQENSGFNTWIDIVDYKHLDDYFKKSKQYSEFFIKNGFVN
jgi:hypothetical protein